MDNYVTWSGLYPYDEWLEGGNDGNEDAVPEAGGKRHRYVGYFVGGKIECMGHNEDDVEFKMRQVLAEKAINGEIEFQIFNTWEARDE